MPKPSRLTLIEAGALVCFIAPLVIAQNASRNHDLGLTDIFTSTFAGGDLRILTNSADAWDEHAHYSPSGATITWQSSMGYPLPQSWEGANGLRSEYWLMKADGGMPRTNALVRERFRSRRRIFGGFEMTNLETAGGTVGYNQFVFRKKAS